jgi:hypothetical protein
VNDLKTLQFHELEKIIERVIAEFVDDLEQFVEDVEHFAGVADEIAFELYTIQDKEGIQIEGDSFR